MPKMREPVFIETVGGLNEDYYRVTFPGSTISTSYGLTEVAELKARVAGQAILWKTGKNVFTGTRMSEEQFYAMVKRYEEA